MPISAHDPNIDPRTRLTVTRKTEDVVWWLAVLRTKCEGWARAIARSSAPEKA